MNFQVLLEPVNDTGFRAMSFQPPIVAEGETRDEALDQLRGLLHERLVHGEVVTLAVPTSESSPLLKLAGTWRDHPDATEFLANLAEYRRQVDADASRP